MNYGKRHPRIIKKCLICGNDFIVIYARRFKNYCSPLCGYKATSEKRKLNNPGGFKKGTQVSVGREWTIEQKIKRGLKWLKDKNPKWKNGISKETTKLRGSPRYKEWRKKVFRRDNWTCRLCNKKGIRINADHIKPWAKYPKLRFVVSNGRTLCIKCHKKVTKYNL